VSALMFLQDDDSWARSRVKITIDCPVDVVFSFICDPRNDPRWLGNVRGGRQVTSGPMGIGSRFRQSGIILGARLEGEWEVTDYVPGRRMSNRSVTGPFVFVREYDCEARGAATRVTKFVAVRLTGALAFLPLSVANGLLGAASERAVGSLKRILEDECRRSGSSS
jgi:uncharacterized membrane protein